MRESSNNHARRGRAKLREARPSEVVSSGAAKPNLYAALSVSERFAQMSQLCRAQWEASGHVIIDFPRSEWPGVVFMDSGEDRAHASTEGSRIHASS